MKLPGGHPGVFGVPIMMDDRAVPAEAREWLVARVGGLPLMVDAEAQVEAMYFDAHAHIDEHAADHPIVFMVMAGRGSVRIGGAEGEVRQLEAGEAVVWPAHQNHTVWTDEEPLEAVVINVAGRTP